MMTLQNQRLLAVADPWGIETGGLGACDECQEKVLVALGLGQVGDTYESGKGVVAGGKQLIGAKNVDGVIKGADQAIKAASGVVSGLDGTWSGAEKFMISLGGTVTAPVLGYRVKAGKLATLPMLWDAAAGAPPGVNWADIEMVHMTKPQSLLNAAAGVLPGGPYLIYKAGWERFGFKPPIIIGGKTPAVGQVWNPFKGTWQGGGSPIIDPEADKTVKTMPSYGTAEGAARIKLIQRSVNTLAGANPAYGFAVAFAKQKAAVAAGNYLLANKGYLFAGPPAGDFPGLVSTIRVLTSVQYVKTALAMNMMVTQGPNTGELLEHLRVGWIKELTALIKAMPQSARPSNAGALGVATTDGTGTGPPIVPDKKPMGGAQAIGALFIIGLLLRFLG